MTTPSAPTTTQDASAAPIAYVNYFQARGNRDEVFLDFGVRTPAQSGQAGEVVTLTHRLALSPRTVRDLTAFLNWLVQQQAKPSAAAQPPDASTGTTPPQTAESSAA